MIHFYKLLSLRDDDLAPHNLGMDPRRIIRTAQLDSVIFVDDTTTVMVTSYFCHVLNSPDTASSDLWSAGKDTVTNDAVWNQDDPEDIKKELKESFHFRNDIDSVIFVGFPVKEAEEPWNSEREAGGGYSEEEESTLPVTKRKFPGMGLPLAVISVSVVAMIVGLYSWRRSHFKATGQSS